MMYYLLLLLLFIICVYTFTHILSSIVKGCITTLGLALIVFIVYVFVSSVKKPVILFNEWTVNNFSITRIKK